MEMRRQLGMWMFRMKGPAWLRRYGLVLAIYLGATYATRAEFMGDTVHGEELILASKLGEFGHLLWYPLGWLLSQLVMPAGRLLVGADARTTVIMTLVVISWLAGLLSVFMLHNVVRTVSRRDWAATVSVVGLIFSQAFLNSVTAGLSYVLG